MTFTVTHQGGEGCSRGIVHEGPVRNLGSRGTPSRRRGVVLRVRPDRHVAGVAPRMPEDGGAIMKVVVVIIGLLLLAVLVRWFAREWAAATARDRDGTRR